ncbi:23S rRNA (uridine(2552)-2'-O)-methyltransferase RlmE [Spongiibacter sp. KMU-166]|uniref:Ribosomal RNA large subunit methyltransferase E n=1 Tax=Spongiibacter thalassae TaxID=2721624 RepID=A0ABX1GIN8_9GAMM|nr:23S rRNA (uridine(2552)-2'-O)-methyltransferase RlmE [Spongiibacter thalassae]
MQSSSLEETIVAKRSGSSGGWLKEHFDDHYVKQSQKDGYRSRACYKLLEIQQKDRLIKPGMCVVDLGAAPGGWSQVAAELVGDNGRVLASDILPMDSLAGVEFVQGDFTEQEVFDRLMAMLAGGQADLVISDMAPNMSGMRDVDQPKAMYLCELALDMADQVLRPGGDFVVKVFQGEGFETYLASLRERFVKVLTRKPAASRPRSREVYLLGRGLKA